MADANTPVVEDEPYVSVFAGQYAETSRQKFKRKVGENPLVPVCKSFDPLLCSAFILHHSSSLHVVVLSLTMFLQFLA